jgi:iron(III) transport system ATP-binding protein
VIRVEKLNKTFPAKGGEVRALRDVDLSVEPGEFFVLLGPSGSGKTTLLRCVAGLERPDSGEIALGARMVFSSLKRLNVPAEERELGMVFQSYAIWPHLSVFENVALPLRQGRLKLSKARLRERVEQALKLVEMEEYADRPAPLLSGGQQQRVALARALAVNPQLLLMDEPLSNLDARLREEVRAKLKSLVASLAITVLYVTHDQVEAMTLADRIAVMAGGKILQRGAPGDLYRSPSSAQVAEFFGSMNWLGGEAIDGRRVRTEIGVFELNSHLEPKGRVVLGIRPEDVRLGLSSVHEANELVGEIRSSAFLGDQLIYEVGIQGKLLLARAMSDRDALKGKVFVHFPRAKIVVFPEGVDLPRKEAD